MKTSKFFSCTGATENRRLNPKDVVPPNFWTLNGMYVSEMTNIPTTPFGTPAFPPDGSDSDSSGRTFICGGYGMKIADGGLRRISWSEPGNFTNFTLTKDIDVDGETVTVNSGAGYLDAQGSTGSFILGQVSQGQIIIFGYDGIGIASLTGEWKYPFSYFDTANSAKPCINYTTLPCWVDGFVYFLATDGFVYKTNGVIQERIDGPFNALAAMGTTENLTQTGNTFLTYDFVRGLVLAQVATKYTNNTFLISKKGSYTRMYDDDGNQTPFIETGVLPLVEEDSRVSIQAVRVRVNCIGVPTISVGVKGLDDADYHYSADYSFSTTGFNEHTFDIAKTVKNPVIKIVSSSGTAAEFHGFTVIYDDGGKRDVS
jgi:hypothetical protein